LNWTVPSALEKTSLIWNDGSAASAPPAANAATHDIRRYLKRLKAPSPSAFDEQ
jgi:hypothetical protein